MIKKIVSLVLSGLLILPANLSAQILPDGTTMTSVNYSVETKTPVLNIAAPSARGVSHNKFKEYNVGSDNLIINNTKEEGLQSKIAGYVAGNPNLIKADKEARIILNEVTGYSRSALSGHTEILGQNAQLIIANPNGISVSGAGFINTSRLSLITGSANMSGGDIDSFNLSQSGRIYIKGRDADGISNLGLDGSGFDALYLVTRGLVAEGDIYSPQINVLTGNNRFNYAALTADSVDMPVKPGEFAVDASALGSMYAASINIIGTEKGFGVRSRGSLTADLDDIIITSGGAVEYKNASAARDIKVNARDSVNASGSAANNNLRVSTSGALALNNARISNDIILNADGAAALNDVSAKNNITLTASSVTGDEIHSGNNFALTAAGHTDLKTLKAGSDINISSSSLTYNTLMAGNDLNVTTAGAVRHLNLAEAGNNINLTAHTLDVTGTNVMLAYGGINLNLSVLNNNSEIAAFKDINITSNTLNNNALILSNQNLNITNGNIFNNKNAVLYAADNLTIKTDGSVYNRQGDIFGDNGITFRGLNNSRISLFENKAGQINSERGNINLYAQTINNLSIDSACNPALNGGRGTCYLDGPLQLTGNRTRYRGDRVVYRKEAPVIKLQALERGYILASGNIYFNAGNVLNQSSLIAAGNTIDGVIDGAFTNKATTFTTTLKIEYQERYKHHKKLHIGCGDRERYFGGTEKTVLASLTPGVVSAPNIRLRLTSLSNGLEERYCDMPWGSTPVNPKLEDPSSSGAVPLPDFDLGGMFRPADPESDYLYVTNNRFINILDFIGSGYFKEHMGFNADLDGARWLGDPVYEQRLLERTILDITGNHYLYDGVADSNAQMKILYDNAFEAYHSDMGLQFGVALTAQQAAMLTDNIVWYVEHEIDGQKVMVPTLYVAAANKDKFLNGSESVIRGGNIDIDAVDIYNSGNIEGQNIDLYASNDIKNISGVIYAEDNVTLEAGNDVIIETKVNTAGQENNGYKGAGYTSSWLGRTAGVYSGGDTNIDAGGDITLKAAELMTGGDATLNAGGDILVGAQTLDNSYWNEGKSENTFITNVGSNVLTGGNFTANAGQNVTIQGSSVGSGGEINLAGENVNVISAVDSSHEYSRVSDGGFMSSRMEERLKDTQTHVGSSLDAAGNININARNDATFLASSLTSGGGDINIEAGNNINILAGENYEATMHNVEKSNWFGLTGSQDRVYDEIHSLEASNVFSGANLNLKSGNDTTIFASDVGAVGDGDIQTGGNLNILSGTESTYHEEYHYEKDFGGFVADFGNGRASVGVSYEEDENTTTDYKEATRASTLDFGGNLNITAEENVTIVGSDVAANAIDVVAENINIMSAEELAAYAYEQIHKEIELTVGVSNAYVNAGLAVMGVVDAEKALEDAIQKLKDAKENPRIKDYSDYETNVALVTAGLASAVIAAAAAAAGAAGSTATLGMSADVQAKTEVTKDTYENESVNQRGSTIIARGGDVNLTAEENIRQQASYVVSEQGDINYTAGGDVTIEAAANTYSENSSHESYVDTLTIGNSNTSAAHSQDKNKSTYESTTWVNSGVYAANGAVNITSGGDTTISGANISAEDVGLNVGGNLLVASRQDEIHAVNSGSGFSVGGGVGNGVNANIGLNNSSGYTDSVWTNNQTSIIGTNSVNVNADTTHIKGAIIANITEDGTDGGGLNLTSNELTFENLEDYHYSENKSSGFNIGLSGVDNPLDLAKHPKGSIGFTLVDSGEEREQNTNATIGQGQITIGGAEATADQLAGLNRNIDASQVITKDELTGGLDAGLTVDLRLLDVTGEGQKEIFGEIVNLPDNLQTATKNFIADANYVKAEVVLAFDKLTPEGKKRALALQELAAEVKAKGELTQEEAMKKVEEEIRAANGGKEPTDKEIEKYFKDKIKDMDDIDKELKKLQKEEAKYNKDGNIEKLTETQNKIQAEKDKLADIYADLPAYPPYQKNMDKINEKLLKTIAADKSIMDKLVDWENIENNPDLPEEEKINQKLATLKKATDKQAGRYGVSKAGINNYYEKPFEVKEDDGSTTIYTEYGNYTKGQININTATDQYKTDGYGSLGTALHEGTHHMQQEVADNIRNGKDKNPSIQGKIFEINNRNGMYFEEDYMNYKNNPIEKSARDSESWANIIRPKE